jgi:F-type H+-transporting ATPase subunit a
MMTINPDKIIIFKIWLFPINATIFSTWLVMIILLVLTFFATRKLTSGSEISAAQNFMESIIEFIEKQTASIAGSGTLRFTPYLGTLLLFIFTSNLIEMIPLLHAPTSSFSTTCALAFTVFISVPVFGIIENGFVNHLKYYLEPVFIMLPLNIITEFSRTIAMAIRLFGNIMSESLIGAILLILVPFFVPVIMQILGLVILSVQAYIFFILATVFIGGAVASGTHADNNKIS